MYPQLKEIFHHLGLNGDEAAVYIALVKSGPMTVLELSKKTNILRATLYKNLSRLESKGLSGHIEKDGKVFQVAEDPGEVLELLRLEREKKEEMVSKFEDLMEDLKKMTEERDRPTIRLFEGLKSIEKLFMMPVEKKLNEILVLVEYENLFNFIPRELAGKFSRERVKKGIRLRILRKKKKKIFKGQAEDDKKELREKRLLPEDMDLKASFIMFGNRLVIFNTLGEPLGILVESKFLVDTLRSIFEKLWQISKEVTEKDI